MRLSAFPLAVSLALFLLLLPLLGSPNDWAADEHFYINGGLIMREGGSLLIPSSMDGGQRLMKPPFFYWMVALSYLVLGANLIAARLPSLLSGLLLLWLVWKMGSDEGSDPAAGTASVSVLAGSYLFLYFSRSAVTDMAMTASIAWGVWLIVQHFRGRAAFRNLYAAALFLGLAALSKGPVALLLAGAGILPLLTIWRNDAEMVRKAEFRHLAPAVLLLIAAGWWYALMAWKFWPDFIVEQADAEVVRRTAMGLRDRAMNLLWYLQRVVTASLPWSIVFPVLLLLGAKPSGSPLIRRLCWGMTGAVVLFYGLFISWRASRYLVPTLPFIAVLAGQTMSGALEDPALRDVAARLLRWVSVPLVLAAILAEGVLLAAMRGGIPSWRIAMMVIFMALLASGALAAARLPARVAPLLPVLALTLAAVYVTGSLAIEGTVRRKASLAAAVATHGLEPGRRISTAQVAYSDRPILFFFGNRDVLSFDSRETGLEMAILGGDPPDPSRYEVVGEFSGPASRGNAAVLRTELGGLLRRGDLLDRLPKEHYYLVRSRSGPWREGALQ